MRIVFFLFIVFVKSFTLENYKNSFSIPFHISVQRPILSPQNHFKLGFSKSAPSSRVGDRWYLGIWYRRFGDVVVWVANRDTPLSKPNGTLEIFNNKLHLLDQYGNSVWSANGTSQSRHTLLTGELLDDGNLVLRYSYNHNSSRLFWQSFDFPTDTLLPGMKVGLDKKSGLMRILRSWKDIRDPSSGDYIYKVEIHDPPEIYVRSKGEPVVRIGPWNRLNCSEYIFLCQLRT